MIKKFSLCTLFLIVHFFLYSQPCLPDGITFTTQDEIDNFQYNFPNCTEIEGDVTIGGWLNNVSNVLGLEELVSIGGNLKIETTYGLTSLEGLENLESIGGGITIFSNNLLQDISSLENLLSIGDYLGVSGNSALVSLSGFNNIESLSGYLVVQDNSSLASLYGLDNLNSIDGELWIYENDALANLSGLSGLLSIGGDLSVIGCDALSDFAGLENLTTIDGDLNIEYNSMMTHLDGLTNLYAIGGNLRLIGNSSLMDLMGLINLSSIGGDLRIGDLYGGNPGNPLLISLSGLDNINPASIDGLFIINNAILSSCEVQSICNYLISPGGIVEIQYNADGCNSIVEVEGACSAVNCLDEGKTFSDQDEIDNFQLNYPNCAEIIGDVHIVGPSITNLSGLHVLTGFWGDLKIENTSITNLGGLDNVNSVGGDLLLLDNEDLNNLDGLDGLYAVDGGLSVTNNDNLSSLSGLENVFAGSLNELTIADNIALSECHVQSICSYLSLPVYVADIHDNDSTCNSEDEVIEACLALVSVNVQAICDISVWPNPVLGGELYIRLNGEEGNSSSGAGSPVDKVIQITIVSIYGEPVYDKTLRWIDGPLKIRTASWPAGIYLLNVVSEGTPQLRSKISILH